MNENIKSKNSFKLFTFFLYSSLLVLSLCIVLYKYNEFKDSIDNDENNYIEDSIVKMNKDGIELVKQLKFQDALQIFQNAISQDKNYKDSYNNLGLVYEELEQFDKAKEEFIKAIEIDSKYFEAYSNLGNLYHKLGKYNLAIEKYEKSIEINPNYYKALAGIGNALILQGNYEGAIENYNKLLSKEPNFKDIKVNLGFAYEKTGKSF